MEKQCKKCWSYSIKKDGKMRNKQRYKCTKCWYVFQNARRELMNWESLWNEYSKWKQSYNQLAEKHDMSIYKVRKLLDSYKLQGINHNKVISDSWDTISKINIEWSSQVTKRTVIVMDTTYFWRRYWIMVFRSPSLHKNLLWKEVRYETKELYIQWITELKEQGWEIEAIVCDWRKWVLEWFKDIPIQMCVFHQMKIVRTQITSHPKLEANKELKDFVSMLWKCRETTMKAWIEDWYERYKDFLKERNEDNKLIHIRTVRAYKSIIHHWDYLFTYQHYRWKISIPTTTNSLEWTFSHLKEKVRIHRWLTPERRQKVIDDYLSL